MLAPWQKPAKQFRTAHAVGGGDSGPIQTEFFVDRFDQDNKKEPGRVAGEGIRPGLVDEDRRGQWEAEVVSDVDIGMGVFFNNRRSVSNGLCR